MLFFSLSAVLLSAVLAQMSMTRSRVASRHVFDLLFGFASQWFTTGQPIVGLQQLALVSHSDVCTQQKNGASSEGGGKELAKCAKEQ